MHINYVHRVRQNNIAQVGFGLLGVIVIMALVGPVLVPYSPLEYSVNVLLPPGDGHWLGTNDVGQDIFSRLVWGARTSLVVAAGVAVLSVLFGMVVGAGAALAGGWVDNLLMRFTDAMLTIPPVLVVILVAAYLQPGLPLLVVTLAAIGWPVGARVIRAQTLTLKRRTHVYAARTFGAGQWRVFYRHILPDLAPVIMVGLVQNARRAVVTEAGLAFLGITDPATVSWGMIIQHALQFSYLDVWQWWLLPAGAALALTILSFSYIGYALEEIVDPRLRSGA